MAPRKRRKVVVCGAGFAGINVAKALETKCDVTLVAPTDRFVYLPLIHEVLSESVAPREVTKRLDRILPKTTLVHGRASKVDGKGLVLASGERIAFDDLVVAIGAESNDFGIPGVKENTLSFYSVGDALQANAMIKVMATQAGDKPVRIVVVGASFTGVEVAGEAAMLLEKLDVEHDITLLDAAPKVFPHQSAEFHIGVEKGLERLNLEVRLNQKIVEVRPNLVVVADAEHPIEIPADVIFWCAGAKPRMVEGVNHQTRSTLQSVARDDVWLVGDAAMFPREMGVPKLAQTAEEQAKIVAWNILNEDRHKHYAPLVKGIIVSIGHNYAVAELAGDMVYTGKIPWHVKRQLYKAKIRLT